MKQAFYKDRHGYTMNRFGTVFDERGKHVSPPERDAVWREAIKAGYTRAHKENDDVGLVWMKPKK